MQKCQRLVRIAEICGKAIKDEYFIFPKHKYYWVVPSWKYIDKYDVCRECGNDIIEAIKERRTDE